MRVALTDPVEPIAEAILREAGHEIIPPRGTGPDALRALCREAEAVIVRQKLPDDLLDHAPRLLAAVRHGVGVDFIPVEACTAAGVLVANVPGANTDAVAEFVVAQMLAIARAVEATHAEHLSAGWSTARARTDAATELRGKTLGIVGLGAIGKKVARLAAAFGMAVLYYDLQRLSEDAEDALGVRFRLLNEVLRASDIVSLHVPLTPDSRRMIGAAEIALMKPAAYLINTCRGPVVDEAALAAALAKGTIAGAGLNVFDQEPPPADNPLFRLPNVVLTPHFAGPTWDNQQARFRNAFDNCQRVARGEKPLWVIPELAG